ncbi:MAG: HlyD family efflux transporter periplasmic adaptor subunit [Maricaulaceae bacterium]
METMLDAAQGTDITDVDILAMTDFLYTQNLTLEPPGGETEAFAKREALKRRPFYEILVHRYLFFRIPLFAPDRFLRATYPFIAGLFTKWALIITALIGTVGVYFTLSQWDEFTHTFWHFFTFEGLAFYILALIGIKSLHELGHAYTAHHYGTRVPTLGVAFLVMFPVLFTDTTDAWRLTDKAKRLHIDGGGIIVELILACVFLCLWAFLPDGPMRSLAFFIATTSWAFSLLVNLNPCMRFDGYYLISDFIGVPNLQQKGFELARWHMRETLFSLGKPDPSLEHGAKRVGLLAYAYTTWVYRLFLFIGIALLVHHMFPKAIGIILFSIEIIFFIIRPIVAEFKVWWSLRMDIISQVKARITLGLFVILAIILFYPWAQSISAPARLEPQNYTDVFPPRAAKIDTLNVSNDQYVKAGTPLLSLSSESLEFDLKQSRARLALLDAQIARRNSNLHERQFGTTLDDERLREQATYAGLTAQKEQLQIIAPQAGLVSNLHAHIHAGRTVTLQTPLLRLSDSSRYKLIAFAPELEAGRLRERNSIIFIPDDPSLETVRAEITHHAPTSRAALDEAELTSAYGGKIAIYPDTEKGLIPVNPVYEIWASLDASVYEGRPNGGRTVRGLAKIKGPRESYAQRIGRQILRVLIREGDF